MASMIFYVDDKPPGIFFNRGCHGLNDDTKGADLSDPWIIIDRKWHTHGG